MRVHQQVLAPDSNRARVCPAKCTGNQSRRLRYALYTLFPSRNRVLITGLGVVSWDAPTTDGIWEYASLLAEASTTLKEYIANDEVSFAHYFDNQIDVGMWTVGEKTLVLATNLNYADETFDLTSLSGLAGKPARQVLDSGASISGDTISFTSVGTGGWIVG